MLLPRKTETWNTVGPWTRFRTAGPQQFVPTSPVASALNEVTGLTLLLDILKLV